jgi:hypothetical protein
MVPGRGNSIFQRIGFKNAGALASILSTVALSLLITSCGLPTVTYLYPPSYFSVENSGISVKNDIKNHDDSEGSTQTYKGIELYYRVYSSEPAAVSTISTLNSLASNYADEPDSFISAATSTYKFSRLRNTHSSTSPLIPIDASDDSRYYLTFSATSNWTLADENGVLLTDNDSNDISQVTRTLDSNPNASSLSFFEKDFNVGATSTDSDFWGSASTSTSDTVYIVFFAVSYGIDQSTVGQAVYSAPSVATSPIEY